MISLEARSRKEAPLFLTSVPLYDPPLACLYKPYSPHSPFALCISVPCTGMTDSSHRTFVCALPPLVLFFPHIVYDCSSVLLVLFSISVSSSGRNGYTPIFLAPFLIFLVTTTTQYIVLGA